jgi:peptidoglycan/xylan/chitin deacetylase (PgdA/CDA1 family)
MAGWPGGARGALCLSFDNLGEAAEIELGAFDPDGPLGDHFTATRVLPALLDALGEHEIPATFFVEGLNAELYPEALAAISTEGHEVAYHAWRHEQWGALAADDQADNLARGIAAFDRLGLEIAGLRPPGGQLGAGGLDVLRNAGLRYCSPAGEGASAEDGLALLPFRWRHVDASCVLPPLGPVREQMTGSADPVDPGAFLAYLEAEVEGLRQEGGNVTLVLHLSMLDWLGAERLDTLLDLLAESSRSGDLWLPPFAEIAEHVLARPSEFGPRTKLDTTSWSA